MAISDLTVNVDVRTRPMLIRILRFPFVFRGHYVTFRRDGVSPFYALFGAWIMAGLIVTFRGSR